MGVWEGDIDPLSKDGSLEKYMPRLQSKGVNRGPLSECHPRMGGAEQVRAPCRTLSPPGPQGGLAPSEKLLSEPQEGGSSPPRASFSSHPSWGGANDSTRRSLSVN